MAGAVLCGEWGFSSLRTLKCIFCRRRSALWTLTWRFCGHLHHYHHHNHHHHHHLHHHSRPWTFRHTVWGLLPGQGVPPAKRRSPPSPTSPWTGPARRHCVALRLGGAVAVVGRKGRGALRERLSEAGRSGDWKDNRSKNPMFRNIDDP